MKKQIGLMLMLMIAVFAFAACGASKSGTDNTEPETDTAFVDSLKTIGDVIALDKDGWSYAGDIIIGSTDEVQMQYGPFVYKAVFDGDIEGAGTDISAIEEATKDMKVKSIEFQSLSMTASDIE